MRGGPAKFELRQFRVKISQSLIENQPVSRILAAFHLISNTGARKFQALSLP